MQKNWIIFLKSWSLGDGHEKIYCNDTLAHHMIERGFKNVKIVRGGDEMKKYFGHYRGGKIVNPVAGRVTIVKR